MQRTIFGGRPEPLELGMVCSIIVVGDNRFNSNRSIRADVTEVFVLLGLFR